MEIIKQYTRTVPHIGEAQVVLSIGNQFGEPGLWVDVTTDHSSDICPVESVSESGYIMPADGLYSLGDAAYAQTPIEEAEAMETASDGTPDNPYGRAIGIVLNTQD